MILSWITIPTAIPFTLQLFAIFLLSLFLDIKYSLFSIILYVLIGAIGLPVFSGFQGGVGVLSGATGGYIAGFIFIVIIVGTTKILFKNKTLPLIISMFIGLFLCYTTGVLWFSFVTKIPLLTAVLVGVAPHIIFDIAKIILAFVFWKKFKNIYFQEKS